MTIINVHDAKTHLSRILERVLSGEDIVIARAGRPLVRLVPLPSERRPRVPGTYAGQIEVSDDFDAPLPAGVLDDFEGGTP